ncbi:MAG: hypothetical protein IJU93_07315 [Lachnospiraceae bacterium]|nr:hypothetical protein [Lachnospiraceae bacterium]
MSAMAQEAIELINILPESDQSLALQMIRKLVLAWDPDFTKLTAAEQKNLDEARADDEEIDHEDINWD